MPLSRTSSIGPPAWKAILNLVQDLLGKQTSLPLLPRLLLVAKNSEFRNEGLELLHVALKLFLKPVHIASDDGVVAGSTSPKASAL